MDSLVALGAAAGLVYSLIEMGLLIAGRIEGMPDLYFESAGMILTLVTVGKYLEQRSVRRLPGPSRPCCAWRRTAPWCAGTAVRLRFRRRRS